ncbi:hypothetical protein EPO56_01860 [Patescibacteria group bacterium]|nr:MAG: hypothetical protein EPO56_01860 [Patescibacteria group bacterium]
MSESKKDKEENRSSNISKHKREGSVLKPPIRQMPMTPSSWKDDRMPQMLWAVLLIANLTREEALDIFRKVGAFVMGHEALSDVTISGIASWPKADRVALLNLLHDSHPHAKSILQTLVLFPRLPAYKDWEEVFGNVMAGTEAQVADFLTKGVLVTLDHQSQEATDCRWVKVFCLILTGKFSMPRSMGSPIVNYPNEGDMREVRPSIRASEISFPAEASEWPEDFWKACLQTTLCAPMPREEQRRDKIKITNTQVNRARHLLLLHFLKTDNSSAIDAKHDTIFGTGFYVLRLLDEMVVTNLSRGAVGRLTLRSCVESFITLAYLIKKDDSNIWNEFRNYGIGQMKLSYLKARDSNDKPAFIDEKFLKQIANEDRWEEFSDIELGHWTSSTLRKLSEEAGCKDIYDAYYDWTSTFSHGSWGAIRESSFAICANPLHRLHPIPSVSVYTLPGVLEDIVKITNLVLQLIESQYPNLSLQIVHEPNPEKRSFLKELYSRWRYKSSYKFLKFITGGK